MSQLGELKSKLICIYFFLLWGGNGSFHRILYKKTNRIVLNRTAGRHQHTLTPAYENTHWKTCCVHTHTPTKLHYKQTKTGGAPVQLNRKWRKWAVYTELGWLRSEVNPRALPVLLCDGQGREQEQVDDRMRGRDKDKTTRERLKLARKRGNQDRNSDKRW